MAEAPNPTGQDLCDAILRYLRTHPQAADSPEGIAQWWVAGGGAGPSPGAVLAALDQLVAAHRISRLSLADGRTLYQSVDKTSGQQAVLSPDGPEPGPKP